MLNQSADLVEKCQLFLKELHSLEISKHNYDFDLEDIENNITNEEGREKLYDRDINLANIEILWSEDSLSNVGGEKKYSEDVYQHTNGVEKEKAAQNVHMTNIKKNEITAKNQILKERLKYLISDNTYYKKVLQQKKDRLKIKKELRENKHIFDFDYRLVLLIEKFEISYENCYNRLMVARDGLYKIFGYDEKLDIKGTDDEKISSMFLWISKAIEFMISYSQLDQSFTRVISVFGLLTKEQINSIRNCTKEEASVIFKVPNTYFKSYENVRLKGVSASIIGQDIAVNPWSISIRLPQKSLYYRNSNEFKIDQTQIPSCFIGRVENRSSFRASETCGLISLNNASPCAQDSGLGEQVSYHLTIYKPNGKKERFESIEDIILEFSLTGKP